MKTLRIAALTFTLALGSQVAHAGCETEAMNLVQTKYGVTAVEVKDLGGGRGGQGSPRDREVWVKGDDGSTYSVFFFAGDCRVISRDIRW